MGIVFNLSKITAYAVKDNGASFRFMHKSTVSESSSNFNPKKCQKRTLAKKQVLYEYDGSQSLLDRL